MKRPIRIILVIGALVATSPVGSLGAPSDPSDRREEVIAQLESRVALLDSRLARMGGTRQRADLVRLARRQRIRARRRQIRQVIENLRAGQPVDPAEIDRILRAAPH